MDRGEWLLLSDEREAWQRRCDGYFRWGWREGFAAGHRAGVAAEAADNEQRWRINAGMIEAQLDPGGPKARELAAAAVRIAENWERRDGWEHWHEFTARAHATPPDQRTDTQRAMVGA